MPPQEIDFSGRLAAEIMVRPPEPPEDAALRRRKDWLVFLLIFGSIILLGLLAIYEGFLDPTASASSRHWGQTAVSALFTGGISFILGQKTATR
ncbi:MULTISPECIES: hypothetical protein [Acidiphilium]|jgi:hypothetical protein|uniref:Uncharacterized protein n=2 Tax=Acidiphilium TaxID=522 RepID=A0A8G2FGC9_ACIRU|nr:MULTISPECIES: hypothetical protein [Acidiphilium]OYW00425.1 MAG: hypothetical protein B7Z58_15500 [Acidiphilium sp. 37-64-53]OZB25643.1 MAG: hypothetical protein B7X49_13345 [Acidiphilium sp. 34-64-41]SIQ84712.1 hypothetical protein SAMN05421828_11099 [Acidiphilium rubrum]